MIDVYISLSAPCEMQSFGWWLDMKLCYKVLNHSWWRYSTPKMSLKKLCNICHLSQCLTPRKLPWNLFSGSCQQGRGSEGEGWYQHHYHSYFKGLPLKGFLTRVPLICPLKYKKKSFFNKNHDLTTKCLFLHHGSWGFYRSFWFCFFWKTLKCSKILRGISITNMFWDVIQVSFQNTNF